MLRKLKFYGSVATVYVLTFGTIGMLFSSSHLLGTTVDAAQSKDTAFIKSAESSNAISGIPLRVIIPSYGIDLAIDTGIYDSATKSWTLSDSRAHYATMTAPANNRAGTTFIYGHGTDAVFGKLGTNRPPIGTTMRIHTGNGHTFNYALQDTSDLKPDQTHILANASEGPPRLIIQTCTGAFSEWRTMFIFSLKGVA